MKKYKIVVTVKGDKPSSNYYIHASNAYEALEKFEKKSLILEEEIKTILVEST